MSDETRKDGGVPGQPEETKELPHREDVMPKDHETYTPQGGGAGTGSGPIREVAAVGGSSAQPAAEGLRRTERPFLRWVLKWPRPRPLGLGGPWAEQGRAGAPERPEVSSFRLLMTLGFAGAVAGALLVFVFLWSDPLIQAEEARVLQEAVTEVLKGPDRFESVFVVGRGADDPGPGGGGHPWSGQGLPGLRPGRESHGICHGPMQASASRISSLSSSATMPRRGRFWE